ncbi:MAG: hypothetical protein COB17_07270 [Sulfurimonas sp.]|nr:MAG: hypothetical protein COB17_07270 [Sulfurimonas sp.]
MTKDQHLKLFDEFIVCLDEARFYDAHETLEEIWFPRRFEDSNEIKLLKGIINATVSFELYKKGRLRQSDKVWRNYLKYRQYLYKVDSIYLNNYSFICRYIDGIKNTKTLHAIRS